MSNISLLDSVYSFNFGKYEHAQGMELCYIKWCDPKEKPQEQSINNLHQI